MDAIEVNFDGLVGPTHNYAGLSEGNIASLASRGRVSDPRRAALQGLAQMRLMLRLGLAQAALPPHERPHVETLRRLGFSGGDAEVLRSAARADPRLLANVASASAMWAANAATVSPSADAADGRVHVTPANLAAKFHRSIEAAFSTRLFRAAFVDPAYFVTHDPVPAGGRFGDEGAANHLRLARDHGSAGLEVFVHGGSAFESAGPGARFEARQASEASLAVARRHGLRPGGALHLRQARRAINAGAFHNDVVAVANESALIAHELAFEGGEAAFAEIRAAAPCDLTLAVAPERRLPLSEVVRSYLFNSQLVTLPGRSGAMALILPEDVMDSPAALDFAQELAQGPGPIERLTFVDLRQSMWNGGGPACLRLRVALTAAERAAVGGRLFLDERLIGDLEAVVARHYRDRLTPNDLGDPSLLDESRRALDEMSALLGLGSIYDFQRV